MKFTIPKKELQAGLAAVLPAVTGKGPFPILINVKLEAKAGAVTFTGTDLEIGIEVTMPATVKTEGVALVPARLLEKIVSKLPADDVTFAVKNEAGDVLLTCAKSKFNLTGTASDDFPVVPKLDDAAIVELPVASLVKGLKQVAYAVAGEDKAAISGLMLGLQAGRLALVATDGYRMSWRDEAHPTDHDRTIIIPQRGIKELVKSLKGVDVSGIQVRITNNQVGFQVGSRYLMSRLIDGIYPPYKQIIPTAFEREVVLDREAFLAAVKRVSVMAHDREASTILMDITAGELTISAGNSEQGGGEESLAIELRGEPIELSFNADYLTQALDSLDGQAVTIHLNNPLAPTLLSADGDTAHTCLVMPVNRL